MRRLTCLRVPDGVRPGKGASALKIALVAAGLDSPGGQAVQARMLVEELHRDGYDVTFIPINRQFPGALRRVRAYPYVRALLNEALYLPNLRQLRTADVVHVFSASYWSFLLAPLPAILIARFLGKRIVLHYHSGEAEDHLARWGPLVHPWLRLVDHIVVPSQFLQEIFRRHGHRARVIPNIVDASRFRYRERNPLRPCLLSARNLEPYYRVDIIIEAFALLKAQRPDATLTIAGSGREYPRLRRLADSLGTDGFRFVGQVGRAFMPRLYDESDIFVNSSIVDNQPVALLEAFAAGLPVVTTPPGDIPAMVRNGDTGLLAPPKDPGAVASAVSTLLADPEYAIAIARRARKAAEQYSWPRVREDWISVYTDR